MKRFLQLALVCTAVAACHTLASQMDQWVGAKDSELVSSFGAPERSITLSDSSRVMTWETTWHDADGLRQTCEKSFTINRSGTVTKWALHNCQKFTR